MSLCVTTASQVLTLALSSFTLAWAHSVEKIEWQEQWQVTPAGLELESARVKGSGAGMEPGEGAVLKEGWWQWSVHSPPQTELILAASGETVSAWQLCTEQTCWNLGQQAQAPIRLAPCAE